MAKAYRGAPVPRAEYVPSAFGNAFLSQTGSPIGICAIAGDR